MRQFLIATAATASLLALGACTNPAATDETAEADAAAEEGMDASADGSESGGASAAGDSGSDASASGGSSGGGSSGGSSSGPDGSVSGPSQPAPTTSTDPMVTGQGSMREEDRTRGEIDMPSEPSHPARQ